MPWGVAAAAVGAAGSIYSSKKAGESSQAAAGVQSDAEQQALEYMKQTEALPQYMREQSMSQLGGLYGIQTPMFDEMGQIMLDEAGNPIMSEQGDPEQIMQGLQATPMYQAIMSGQGAGEEAIMRNAGATGGLRSGGANENLARYSGDLQNQALMSSMSGLQDFSRLPSNTNNIAGQMGQIGNTQAMGLQAAGQAQQQGYNNASNALMGGANMYLNSQNQGYFSDIRLKTDIKDAGSKNGHNWYTWKWNDEAKALNLEGESEGVMAHEVAEYLPDAVTTNGDYLIVNYDSLGVTGG